MRILLGVTGGIVAYKAVLLLRLLTEAGHALLANFLTLSGHGERAEDAA